mmetsp:Transcript_16715/g.49154  ORF Transcript_16715/g.49154 Transcript_16715/m.49154 type:complete len:300 (-) Transcript_16715:579-1478(-)
MGETHPDWMSGDEYSAGAAAAGGEAVTTAAFGALSTAAVLALSSSKPNPPYSSSSTVFVPAVRPLGAAVSPGALSATCGPVFRELFASSSRRCLRDPSTLALRSALADRSRLSASIRPRHCVSIESRWTWVRLACWRNCAAVAIAAALCSRVRRTIEVAVLAGSVVTVATAVRGTSAGPAAAVEAGGAALAGSLSATGLTTAAIAATSRRVSTGLASATAAEGTISWCCCFCILSRSSSSARRSAISASKRARCFSCTRSNSASITFRSVSTSSLVRSYSSCEYVSAWVTRGLPLSSAN